MELLLLVIIAVFIAAVGIYSRSPSVKGARGERRVHKVLSRLADEGNRRVIHDLTLGIGINKTQIDHVFVSRFGVFVIETKNYSGWIFGGERSRQWTQVIYKNKTRFQNPLRQNYKHTKAVESFLRIHSSRVHSIVVFVGDSEFKAPMPENVVTLRGLVPYILTITTRVFTDDQVETLANQLFDAKSGIRETERKTPDLRAVPNNPICPRCDSEMVLRTARKGNNVGGQFWGCSQYPKCRATKQKG
jgi:hypothetical protein